jgi:hypothetical protein
MKLLEFFQFSDTTNDIQHDRRYDASRDSTVLDKSDTRKAKLTLRHINQMRMQSEAHIEEKKSEAEIGRAHV